MPHPPIARPSRDRPETPDESNQPELAARARQADAFGAGVPSTGDQGVGWGGDRGGATAGPPLDVSQLTARDLAVLRQLVQLRLLRYDQLHRIAFAAVDRSIARRRIRHLARGGWLSTWEAPSRRGGHARYAHPTAGAIRVLLPTLVPDAPWAPLVAGMLPRFARRPLELETGTPKWLPHQREVNHLVASAVTSPARRILWASSWDCPFPARSGAFTMPQPDYVLVEEVRGTPRLIFGEHDRGSEPLERFVARKVALYSALAAFPEVCAQRFGIAAFRVHVSVVDPFRRAPIARLRALLVATRMAERADVFRFTLGGWLSAQPAGSIWFRAEQAPATDSPAWDANRLDVCDD